MQEKFGDHLKGLRISWVGDGNNVSQDIMLAAPLLGVNCSIATPKGYEPNAKIVQDAKNLAKIYGTELNLFHDPLDAVRDANVVVTDTWVSMGQESEAKKRIKDFEGYQITMKL